MRAVRLLQSFTLNDILAAAKVGLSTGHMAPLRHLLDNERVFNSKFSHRGIETALMLAVKTEELGVVQVAAASGLLHCVLYACILSRGTHTRDHSLCCTNYSASATAISISHTRFPYRLTTGNCCVPMLLLIFQEPMQGPTPSAAPAAVNPQQTSVCDTLAISTGLPLFCVMHACILSLSRGTQQGTIHSAVPTIVRQHQSSAFHTLAWAICLPVATAVCFR